MQVDSPKMCPVIEFESGILDQLGKQDWESKRFE